MATRELTDQEIQSLVKDLESLQAGSAAAAALVGCGERAIAPLRSYLLTGRPRGVYQPRQLAVLTLGELGARDALMEYVDQNIAIQDAVVRFGEEAVRSTAARELGRWREADVFACLIRAGARWLLPGIVDALGKFSRMDAMDYFLRALSDDVCRANAEEAIRAMGDQTRPSLVISALEREPSRDNERPSSIERRRAVLRLLGSVACSEDDWSRLRELLEEADPEIVIRSATIALAVGPTPDQWHAVTRMIEVLPRADWFLRTEARTVLAEHFAVAEEPIEDEIARRMRASTKEQALDAILRLLVNLRGQVRAKDAVQ